MKQCKWCLAAIDSANPRRLFCGVKCRQRHASRSRTHPDDADGYGFRMVEDWNCRECLQPFAAGDRRQGARPRLVCDECLKPKPKTCPSCGVEHRGQSMACSDRCSLALRRRHYAAKSKVRAERVAESPEDPIDPMEIFERDNWTCQICGLPVDRSAVHPDAQAPVMDHIIPISADGSHIRSNIQCAHSRCNTLKGALIYRGCLTRTTCV